jgi:hypothetical protein
MAFLAKFDTRGSIPSFAFILGRLEHFSRCRNLGPAHDAASLALALAGDDPGSTRGARWPLADLGFEAAFQASLFEN